MWFAPKIATVHRRADAAAAAPRLRRHRALPRERRDRDAVLHPAVADHVGLPHAVPRRRAVRPRRSAGSARCATTTPCPWSQSLHQLWPHTALGLACLGDRSPRPIRPRIPYALLLAGGPALSIPLAVVTARPAVGAALARIGIGRLPEETAPPRRARRAGAAGARGRRAAAGLRPCCNGFAPRAG